MKGIQLFSDSYCSLTLDSRGLVCFFVNISSAVFEGKIVKALLHQIKIRREKLYEMKCHDLDLISLIYYISFSLLNLQDFQYVLSLFNENLLCKVFERCKPVVFSEASSASPAHYSCLFAWTSSTLQKPEDQYESNDNAELKNTSEHRRRP